MRKTILFLLLILISPLFSFSQITKAEWECKSMNERDIINISALSDCYGYVRYFYPNPHLKEIDWMKFLMYAIEKIQPVKYDNDLKTTLLELFKPLCPQISFSEHEIFSQEKISAPFYAVEYKAIGTLSTENVIKHYLPAVGVNRVLDCNNSYNFKLKKNIYLNIPLAIKNLPKETDDLKALLKEINKIDDGGVNLVSALFNAKKVSAYNLPFKQSSYRIADLIIRKNIIQHFYPYYHEDGLANTWNSHFEKSIKEMALVNNLANYYLGICKFLAPVNDSHVRVWNTFNAGAVATYSPFYYPDLSVGFVNDTCFVIYAGKAYDKQIRKGDVLISINNKTIHDVIQEKLSYTSYSTHAAGLYQLSVLGNLFESSLKDSVLNVVFRDNDYKTNTIQLKTNLPDRAYVNNSTFMNLDENGIAYINLCSDSCKYENFVKKIPILQAAQGIVFDVRGRPRQDVLSVISHFIHQKIELGNLLIPIIRFPNQQGNEYELAEKWYVVPATAPESKEASKRNEYKLPLPVRIDKPLIFLANEKTISFGESFVEMMKHYKVGTIVGTHTAGCNGDVTRLSLPSASFFMTCYKFTNRDGSQHHGVGVEPDVYSELITLDFQNNIDTQLECAKKQIAKNEKDND